ncbi:MAG: EpsI family protein [Desulforhopalus sp.]
MGHIKPIILYITIFLFGTVALIISMKPEGTVQMKGESLSATFSTINNWKGSGRIVLQPEIIEALDLDDYLFQSYNNDGQTIGMYIGYYLTSGKLGAAHDPLVCLPGQGWLIKQRGEGEVVFKNEEKHRISYSTMVVDRHGELQMFLYWFQTYDKAVAGTLSQKLASLKNKITGSGQSNAFVRLNCDMTTQTEQQCQQLLTNFTKEFYPGFLKYVRNED